MGAERVGGKRGRFEAGCLHAERKPDAPQIVGAYVAGHPPEEPDLLQSRRQDVQKKTADEDLGGQRHCLLGVAVGAIPVAEGDLSVGQLQDAVVADGDLVGIASEIFEDLRRSGERLFGVDDPVDEGQPGADRFPVCDFFGQHQPFQDATLTLDFYHACEYLSVICNGCSCNCWGKYLRNALETMGMDGYSSVVSVATTCIY